MQFYNSHIHTFIDKDIPEKFLPLGLVRVLSRKAGFRIISRVLNYLNPWTDDDQFDRYVKFIKIGRLGSQEKIFGECKKFYPDDTLFGVLSMDMAYMGAGKVPRAYPEQLKELSELRRKYPQVIPFIHIDPRRDNYMDILKKSIEELGFKGVKIYPPLGYFPYDECLYPVYEYCEAYNLPVISHCSPHNPVHFKGSKKDLIRLLSKSKTPIDMKNKKRKELCANFTHPKNWEYVFNDFKKLKLCLAHFGSAEMWGKYIETPDKDDNWFVYIKDMIPRYENLYTDISFTLHREEFFPLLKVLLTDKKLRDRILFGSDYYMVETECNERRFGLDLRAYLGEEYFNAIAVINPKGFFGA